MVDCLQRSTGTYLQDVGFIVVQLLHLGQSTKRSAIVSNCFYTGNGKFYAYVLFRIVGCGDGKPHGVWMN